MSSDNLKKTIGVALGVCLVASILVSTAAVELKPIQTKNAKLDLLKNILEAGDLYSPGVDIQQTYNEKISAELIELETGKPLTESEYTAELTPEKFDLKSWASSPELGTPIPSEQDLADIKRQPKYMAVYTVKNADGEIEKYIMPIMGTGLWSTLYGFIALDKDLKTIKGFTFYEHGETPGLGGEVDNPKWKQQWVGKKAFDDNWDVKIQVLKGTVDETDPNKQFKVDGLSGSTLTTRGVDNLVRYWLGENGYGHFIDYLRGES